MFKQYKHPVDVNTLKNQFDLVSLTHSSSDEGWYNILHYHDFIEIIYCLSGSGYLQTAIGKERLYKHRTLIINKFIEHTEFVDEGKELEYLVIAVKGPNLTQAQEEINMLFSYHDYEFIFYRLVKDLLHEIYHTSLHSEAIIEHLVQIFLLKLVSQSSLNLEDIDIKSQSLAVANAKKYIDDHYSQTITLDKLASLSYISRYHLSHLFKVETGLTVIEYLQSVRFNHAITLLLTTNMSIAQIAFSTGFNSSSYFSKQFKAKLGLSPHQYRKSKHSK